MSDDNHSQVALAARNAGRASRSHWAKVSKLLTKMASSLRDVAEDTHEISASDATYHEARDLKNLLLEDVDVRRDHMKEQVPCRRFCRRLRATVAEDVPSNCLLRQPLVRMHASPC